MCGPPLAQGLRQYDTVHSIVSAHTPVVARALQVSDGQLTAVLKAAHPHRLLTPPLRRAQYGAVVKEVTQAGVCGCVWLCVCVCVCLRLCVCVRLCLCDWWTWLRVSVSLTAIKLCVCVCVCVSRPCSLHSGAVVPGGATEKEHCAA